MYLKSLKCRISGSTDTYVGTVPKHGRTQIVLCTGIGFMLGAQNDNL